VRNNKQQKNPNPAFSSSFFPYTTTITQASAAALVH
jgi:hypothetical protein